MKILMHVSKISKYVLVFGIDISLIFGSQAILNVDAKFEDLLKLSLDLEWKKLLTIHIFIVISY